jgi:hypothetical protein
MVQERLDLLAPWLGSSRSEPMAESVSFLHTPFTFEGVDGEAVVL